MTPGCSDPRPGPAQLELFAATRRCALPGCGASLDGRRMGTRFCCQDHQIQAWKAENAERWGAYMRAWRLANPRAETTGARRARRRVAALLAELEGEGIGPAEIIAAAEAALARLAPEAGLTGGASPVQPR